MVTIGRGMFGMVTIGRGMIWYGDYWQWIDLLWRVLVRD